MSVMTYNDGLRRYVFDGDRVVLIHSETKAKRALLAEVDVWSIERGCCEDILDLTILSHDPDQDGSGINLICSLPTASVFNSNATRCHIETPQGIFPVRNDNYIDDYAVGQVFGLAREERNGLPVLAVDDDNYYFDPSKEAYVLSVNE